MHCASSGNLLSTAVAQRDCIKIGEKVFAGAKEYRADSDMQFIDKPGLKILTDCGDTPAKPNILPIGRLLCTL